MNYRQERDQFIREAALDGFDLSTITKLLRYATTLQRYAVAECNGDWPCDNGERKTAPCSRCQAGYVRHTHRTANDGTKVCPNCRTEELVNAVLPEGVTAVFGGDPRGAVFRLATPRHPYADNGVNPKTGYGGANGLYVPARER